MIGDNLSVRLPVGTGKTQLRLLSLTGRVIIRAEMNGPATELGLPGLSKGRRLRRN
jgi:hypothetical protein